MNVRKKRRKYICEPGQYWVLSYQGSYYSYVYRLIYVIDVYKCYVGKRGKKLKYPQTRYLYVRVDFPKQGDRWYMKTGVYDHAASTFRLYTHLSNWSQLTETDMDLNFVVKYGGPNVIARQVLEDNIAKRERAIKKAQDTLEKHKGALSKLDQLLKSI